MRYCIWDLDSTLCDTRHRRHLMPERDQWSTNGAWDKFSDACDSDSPILPNIVLYQALKKTYVPVILSARAGTDFTYRKTREWLNKHGVTDWYILMLRSPGNDHLSPTEWKKQLVRRWQEMGNNFGLAVDDHPGTAEVYQELGIPTVVVTPPGLDFSQIPHV